MANVKVGDNVTVEYEGKLKDGTVFASSQQQGNLKFRVGEGRVMKPLENAVVGMEPGQEKKLEVPAAEAYGRRHEEAVVQLARERFPADFGLEVGKRVQLPKKDGGKINATITEIKEDRVTLDANHPLAGEDLLLAIKLLDIG